VWTLASSTAGGFTFSRSEIELASKISPIFSFLTQSSPAGLTDRNSPSRPHAGSPRDQVAAMHSIQPLIRLLPFLLLFTATAGGQAVAQVVDDRGLVAGPQQASNLMRALTEVRTRMEMVGETIRLVQWDSRYCRPPLTPNKGTEYTFLDGIQKELDGHRNRYMRLKRELSDLLRRNQAAISGIGGANVEDASYWAPWEAAFRTSRLAIQQKRRELDAVPVVNCQPQTEPAEPSAADVRPPETPGIPLPEWTVRQVDTPGIPVRFCSAAEKDAVLERFYAVHWDFWMNYQDAREYLDAIVQALERGQGNREALTRLLPEARSNLELHTRRLDEFQRALDQVRGMRVENCTDRPQASVPIVEIVPPAYVPFVRPVTPDRWCSEAERARGVASLRSARDAANINYEKATLWVAELAGRMGQGDRSAEVQAAFDRANDDSSRWMRLFLELEEEFQRVFLRPIEECADQPRTSDEVGSLGPGNFFFEEGGTYAQSTRPLAVGPTVGRNTDFERNSLGLLVTIGMTQAMLAGSPVSVFADVGVERHLIDYVSFWGTQFALGIALAQWQLEMANTLALTPLFSAGPIFYRESYDYPESTPRWEAGAGAHFGLMLQPAAPILARMTLSMLRPGDQFQPAFAIAAQINLARLGLWR
jgi:hypothetical protein